MNSSGVGDTTYFGPEAEFFIFDDVRFDVGRKTAFYYVDSKEGAYKPAPKMTGRQSGPPSQGQGRLFPGAAGGLRQDMRGEMLAIMGDMGINRKSTITKSPAPSMNLASSSTR